MIQQLAIGNWQLAKPTAKPFTTEATEAHRGILICQKNSKIFSRELTRKNANQKEICNFKFLICDLKSKAKAKPFYHRGHRGAQRISDLCKKQRQRQQQKQNLLSHRSTQIPADKPEFHFRNESTNHMIFLCVPLCPLW